MDNIKQYECPVCEWKGLEDELTPDGYCPVCRYPDREICEQFKGQ